SGTATHTVSKATPTVTITSDTPDPAAVGASYTVAYTVAGAGATPTGSITVSDGAATCTGSLTGGAGSCVLSSLAAGAKTLTASYAGDTNYNATSGTTAHTVDKGTPTVAITGDNPDASAVGASYTVAVAVTGAGA